MEGRDRPPTVPADRMSTRFRTKLPSRKDLRRGKHPSATKRLRANCLFLLVLCSLRTKTMPTSSDSWCLARQRLGVSQTARSPTTETSPITPDLVYEYSTGRPGDHTVGSSKLGWEGMDGSAHQPPRFFANSEQRDASCYHTQGGATAGHLLGTSEAPSLCRS